MSREPWLAVVLFVVSYAFAEVGRGGGRGPSRTNTYRREEKERVGTFIGVGFCGLEVFEDV